jgi:prepilin-type N-terminal cleavage/methylation domain-containing protein
MKVRQAFTLIEVIIAVLILSTSIILVLKIHSQTREEIEYIVQRNKYSLQDSLFTSRDVLNYHRDTKAAYDIVSNHFKVDDLKSRDILKNIHRTFFIPEPYTTKGAEDTNIPSAQIDEIKMKDKFSSYYFHFSINGI